MVHFTEPKEIVSWVLLGLISGLIARRVIPGEEKSGCFVTIGLGIIGAFVGGWIGRHFGFLAQPDPGTGFPPLHSLLTATVGAMVVLALWKWIKPIE